MTVPAGFLDAIDAGLSARETADRFGVSPRTVRRWRSQTRTASRWTPTPPRHGTRSRYQRGCPCVDCKAANAAYTATHRALYARAARQRGGQLTLI